MFISDVVPLQLSFCCRRCQCLTSSRAHIIKVTLGPKTLSAHHILLRFSWPRLRSCNYFRKHDRSVTMLTNLPITSCIRKFLYIVVLAPLANLGRNPSLDGGNAKPLCDMAVGMPVVGTLDSFNDGSSKARFGYIEWTLASSAEWSLEAPRSFFSLEHMISTDILNWSLKSFEHEVLLPQGAHDSLFVVYASD